MNNGNNDEVLIYVFLYQNLNLVYFEKLKMEDVIYVFLYQNLNGEELQEQLKEMIFMYFYIRI